MRCARGGCTETFDRSEAVIASKSPVSDRYYCSSDCLFDDLGYKPPDAAGGNS